MIHMNEIDLYWEPRNKILPLLPEVNGEPEMSSFDSAFLCGAIRKFMPNKIVEVGIAGGGTTEIILQCIYMLGLDTCSIYSVDYSNKFYRNNAFSSGYLGSVALELIPELKNRHQFLLGNIACTWNEKLRDCDFLIIDTTHFLPGEVLDFITLLPILRDGAVVVLHDIQLNQMRNKEAVATGVVFSAAVGEKYMNWDNTSLYRYPNIGAVIINEETRKHIANMFLSLLLTWSYLPDEKQTSGYRRIIAEYYDKTFVDIFNSALELNTKSYKKNRGKYIVENATYLFPFHRIWAGARIILFGAGEVGKSYKHQIDNLKYCDIVNWVDSSWKTIDIADVVSPYCINDAEFDYVLIATLKEEYAEEMMLFLHNVGISDKKIVWERRRKR